MRTKAALTGLLAVLAGSEPAWAKTVRYELRATRGQVNLSGKAPVDFALMLNGSIPAPTLEFTEGDDVEILVQNRIEGEELSIHWHGLLLPNAEDGVAYVTTPPILSGQDRTFRFRLRQSGTYWYHSHTNVQEQKGLYGAFVIHPRGGARGREVVAVLSDWSDEDASQILRNLRKDGDYYQYKKGTVRSWIGALAAGRIGNFLYNEWTRMGGMDLSDVGYDAFLVNGKPDAPLLEDLRSGEKVRIRLINAAASTYFYVALGGQDLRVVAADGVDIEPQTARELLMGMAETYDLEARLDPGRSTELRITAQDGTGSASAWLGRGEKVRAPVRPVPDLYAVMDHGAGHDGHGHHEHHGHHAEAVQTLGVDELQARRSTQLSPHGSGKVLNVKLELGGDMRRYVWHLNGNAIHEDRNLVIDEGDLVRFTLVNRTMMHHPMHLHGHFFRVLNRFGDRSPLKHTVDVPPHGERTIEFLANEPGEWMLHCHNLYHLKTGMARVVKYSTFTPAPETARHQKHDPHLHDHLYFSGRAEAASNHAQLQLRLSQTWNELTLRAEARNTTGAVFAYNVPWEIEGDLLYERWFGQYFHLAAGATLFDRRPYATLGAEVTLPFLIEAQAFVTHAARVRLGLEKRFQWTSFLYSDVDVTWRPVQSQELSSDFEFEVSLMVGPSWAWAAGLMLTDRNVGFGVEARF